VNLPHLHIDEMGTRQHCTFAPVLEIEAPAYMRDAVTGDSAEGLVTEFECDLDHLMILTTLVLCL